MPLTICPPWVGHGTNQRTLHADRRTDKSLHEGLVEHENCAGSGWFTPPPQVHRLQSGIQLVIATPGRLLEVLAKADIDMSYVKTLVLDEVDTMLQLGFEGQVNEINLS